MTNLVLEARTKLAMEIFPEEWADNEASNKTNKVKGKMRNSLRNRAEKVVKEREHRAAGGSCGNCHHSDAKDFKTFPVPKGQHLQCSIHSDFWGIAYRLPGNICEYWTPIKD